MEPDSKGKAALLPSREPNTTDGNQEDITRLSPFVVQASPRDVGYYAEITLAGSRLNTNLGDLAASITVVTRQQMLDTASVDINDVFLYEANTEGTGTYTAFSFNDQGGVTDQTSRSPVTANRVRGIGSPDRAHNYYLVVSSMPFDVYNIESMEINRGPNALLFGIGSAAGIVNHSTSRANLRTRSREVSARFGSYDGYRASFRFNEPIIRNKLAVFVAGLYDSRGFPRKPSRDISRRAYAAITYAPTASTSIRANYERYTGSMVRPNSVTSQDGISEWRAAGRPTYDPLTFTYTVNGVATRLPTSEIPVTVPGLVQGGGSQPQLYYDNGRAVLWMQTMLSPTDIRGPFPSTHPRLSQSSTYLARNRNSLPLFRQKGITDKSIYDWDHLNTTAGNFTRNKADVYNVEVDQRLFNNLYAQAGWYRQEFTPHTFGYNAEFMTMIDTDTRRLDGTANPFFGRPFFYYSNGEDNIRPVCNDNYRAGLAYKLDFHGATGWRRWLGTHQFFAIGTRREVDTTIYSLRECVTSDHAWINPAVRAPGYSGGVAVAVGLIHRMYVGGPDGNITQPGRDAVHGPFTTQLRHAVPGPGGSLNFNGYTWTNEPVTLDLAYHTNTRRTYERNDGATFGLQSSFWKDRVVTTVGFRRDKNETKASRALALASNGFLSLENLNNWGPSQVIFGNTTTAGVVAKPLPWLSFTHNQAKNFTPGALRLDIFGNPLPLPNGEGKDYGVRLNLWDNKLVLGVNLFKTDANRARGTPADAYISRASRFETAFITWANQVAQERLGPGASTSAVATEVARITQLPVGYLPPPVAQVGSTSTVEAEGSEVQLTYNPVRHFNLKATFGKQKTSYSAIAPEFEAYATPRLPIWKSARDTQGNLWWTSINVYDVNNPQSFWASALEAPMSLGKALEGKRTQGQREWQASVIATYRPVEGVFKGYEIGGAGRFMDDAIIGYFGKAAQADGVIRELDPNRPIFDRGRPTADFWVSKNFTLPKLLARDMRARIQLNVRDVFRGSSRLDAIAVNPDGSPSTFRIIDPREWYLTTTLTF
jgi:outer membrane receptor protein involved in Fe transport